MLVEAYARAVEGMLRRVVDDERGAIDEAAAILARAIADGGMVHLFGSGHSASVAREAVGRAGALVACNLVVDPTGDAAERVPGYAEALLSAYERQYGVRPGEALVVVSNSGLNPLPVELAQRARARGLATVGIVNAAHARAAPSRCPDGARLPDVVDVVLDTHGVPGDGAVAMDDGTPVGPTSTVVGAFVLHALVLRTIERLQEAGVEAPVLLSENLPDRPADARNAALRERYRGRIRYPGA